MKRPIGYFVHHQGRGHAERAAAAVNALPDDRPVTLFCARDDIFPALNDNIEIVVIPSLFEAEAGAQHGNGSMQAAPTPSTLHCAPLGWRGITHAVATIAQWFDRRAPALFVTDVSAELAQFARIASIPTVAVIQHGDRSDPGHLAAYEGAVGILAPYSASLEQPERPAWLRSKSFYAPGLGVTGIDLDRQSARRALGLPLDREIVVVVAGGGGEGSPATPLTLGARADPSSQWFTIGSVVHAWHETPPTNLVHKGWVDNPATWIAAADRLVSSAGNTTVHQIASTDKPWIVVPEWRYFSEQLCKARMLDRVGAAALCEHWPASAVEWDSAWIRARAVDTVTRGPLVAATASQETANWLEALIARCWGHEEPTAVLGIVEIAQ